MEDIVEKSLHYENLKSIKYTHIATTIEFAHAIGEELGFNKNDLKEIEIGAALHDIGKSLIPVEIINKKGRLTEKERHIINYHSILGYELLKALGYSVNIAEIARDHHNPASKNQMAQIVRAADIYSAMREERSYKKAKTHDEAMIVLRNCKIPHVILNALEKRYGKNQPQSSVSNPIQHFSIQPATV